MISAPSKLRVFSTPLVISRTRKVRRTCPLLIPAGAPAQQVLDSGMVITFGKLEGYVTSIWPTAQVQELPINITYMDGSSPNIDTWSALVTPVT